MKRQKSSYKICIDLLLTKKFLSKVYNALTVYIND